jgi:hypothetical protein
VSAAYIFAGLDAWARLVLSWLPATVVTDRERAGAIIDTPDGPCRVVGSYTVGPSRVEGDTLRTEYTVRLDGTADEVSTAVEVWP